MWDDRQVKGTFGFDTTEEYEIKSNIVTIQKITDILQNVKKFAIVIASVVRIIYVW